MRVPNISTIKGSFDRLILNISATYRWLIGLAGQRHRNHCCKKPGVRGVPLPPQLTARKNKGPELENVPFQAFISQAANRTFLLGQSSSALPATLSWFISSAVYLFKFPSCRNCSVESPYKSEKFRLVGFYFCVQGHSGYGSGNCRSSLERRGYCEVGKLTWNGRNC